MTETAQQPEPKVTQQGIITLTLREDNSAGIGFEFNPPIKTGDIKEDKLTEEQKFAVIMAMQAHAYLSSMMGGEEQEVVFLVQRLQDILGVDIMGQMQGGSGLVVPKKPGIIMP